MAYCYFSAYLKLSVFNGKQRWAGPFDSRQVDGTSCGSGYMTIMENAPPLDEPTKVESASRGMRVQEDAPRPAPTKAPAPVVPPPPPPTKDTFKLIPPEIQKPKPVIVLPPKKIEPPKPTAHIPIDTSNCLRSYDWESESLSFDVWDGWAIDGDIISLSVGGKMLLDHVKLSEAKQHFNVPLAKGVNIISVFFYDEGFDAPNTPNMIIFDGDRALNLNISGKNGESARICINRTR